MATKKPEAKEVRPFSIVIFPIRNGIKENTIVVRQWLPIEITDKILGAIPNSQNPEVSLHLFPIRKRLMQLTEVGILMSGLRPKDSRQKVELLGAKEMAKLLAGKVEPRTSNSAVLAYLCELPENSHVVVKWQY